MFDYSIWLLTHFALRFTLKCRMKKNFALSISATIYVEMAWLFSNSCLETTCYTFLMLENDLPVIIQMLMNISLGCRTRSLQRKWLRRRVTVCWSRPSRRNWPTSLRLWQSASFWRSLGAASGESSVLLAKPRRTVPSTARPGPGKTMTASSSARLGPVAQCAAEPRVEAHGERFCRPLKWRHRAF